MKYLFKSIANRYEKEFAPFHPFCLAKERAFYQTLDKELKSRILKEGESYLGYNYPSLKPGDFMAFTRTGNRTDYESIYFALRHALNALVVAECVEYKGRFMDDIIHGICALCEETAWQLPAHNSYIRDTASLLLPDGDRPVLDLFACETGASLACVYFLLKDELNSISPFITALILKRLKERIIRPYLKEHFWWMGKGSEPMCNWTVWCTQNILLTAFFCDWDISVKKRIFKKAALSLDYFLKDYGPDGCCEEGAQYYRHAGLCLFGCMEILNQVTSDYFQPLYQNEKIINLAAYIVNVHVEDKYYFNFGDCSPVAGRAGVREFIFGKRTGQPAMMSFAAKDFLASGKQLYSDDSNRINLYYQLFTLGYYDEVCSFRSRSPLENLDIYYPSKGLFIARNDTFCLGVKAGCNNESHNHNDTGSFILYKNGQPLFVDIGVESYTKKTFSPERYEIWTMQSCYHNLPTIMGADQKDGPDFKAVETEVSLASVCPSISMELIHAYPLEDKALSYRRKVSFPKKENRIILTDSTNAGDVILNFITYEKPVISENRISIGSLGTAYFTGAVSPFAEVLKITDQRLMTAWDHDLYRIRLKLTGSSFTLTIE